MALSGGDKTWIVYEGPPRWDGAKWVNGDKFFLSGNSALQGREGVELAPGVSGLTAPVTEYRYDTSANIPGSNYQDNIDGRRIIQASVNILGKNPKEVQDNFAKWNRNHPEDEPGKLWIFHDDHEPRYLYARRSAESGVATLEKDPANRNLYEKLEWGWDADDAYFRGFRSVYDLNLYEGKYQRTFYNPSTAREVFPEIYLPGGSDVSWRVPRGYMRGEFITPKIGINEEVRISYDPSKNTFVKRNIYSGELTNLWPTMTGNRPKLSFEPETKNTFSLSLASGALPPRAVPRLAFVPMFKAWV